MIFSKCEFLDKLSGRRGDKLPGPITHMYSITYHAYLFHLEMRAEERKEDPAWEPKVCAFHLSNQKLIPEKFASNRDVPVNLNSLPFLAEVTE